MQQGFDFFRTNTNNQEYELSSILNLPKLFKLFVSVFEVGSNCLKTDTVLDEDEEYETIGSIRIKLFDHADSIYLNDFIDSKVILEQWDISKNEIEWEKHELLRIALLGQAGFGGLYLGCGQDNLDEIWCYNIDSDIQFIKLSDNIFEFVKQLEFSKDFSNIDEKEYGSLYKNWNEDFWRIKQEDRFRRH